NPTLSDKEGAIDLKDVDIDDADSVRDLSIMIENQVFDAVIYKPYLLLQYGQTDEEEIHQEGVDNGITYENGETRITQYLNTNPYSSKGIDKREDRAEKELAEIGNTNIFAGNGFKSASYIIGSILSTVVQAIVFFFLGLIRILMQFALIIALICLSIILVISLIPTFETLLASYMKTVMKIVLFKGILLFFILVSTSFISLSYAVTEYSSNMFYRMFVQILFTLRIIFIYLKLDFALNMLEGASATIDNMGAGKMSPSKNRMSQFNPLNKDKKQNKSNDIGNKGNSSLKSNKSLNKPKSNLRKPGNKIKDKVTPMMAKT